MWNKIVNPKTGRKVNVNSKIGKNVLRNYMKQLGGAEVAPWSAEQMAVDLNKGNEIPSRRYISSVPINSYYNILEVRKDEFDDLVNKMVWNTGHTVDKYTVDEVGSVKIISDLYNEIFDLYYKPFDSNGPGPNVVLFRDDVDGKLVSTMYNATNKGFMHLKKEDQQTLTDFYKQIYNIVRGAAVIMIPNEQFDQ